MQLNNIKFDEKGLVPAIVQDVNTKEVLMMAWMNEESLQKTMETGYTWFYSRSRQKLWNKGETSGNMQKVFSIEYDCDGDCLLITADQKGAACHTGARNCFFTNLWKNENEAFSEDFGTIIKKLTAVVEDRKANPKEGSYTNYLFEKGNDKILKKVGEESSEVIIATKNNDKSEMVYEISDLIYHLTVLMVHNGVSYQDIANKLKERAK